MTLIDQVIVFLITLVARYLFSQHGFRWGAGEPQPSRTEKALEKEIEQLRKEAKKLNSVETFVAFAKAGRRVVQKEKELDALQLAREQAAKSFPLWWRRAVPIIQELILHAGLYLYYSDASFGFLCSSSESVADEQCWAFGPNFFTAAMGKVLAWPLGASRTGPIPYSTVGLLPWLIWSQATSRWIISSVC